MKKISLISIFLCVSFAVFAQNNARACYRGLVDLGYSYNQWNPDFKELKWIELNTSHGYQINPYFFVGAGTGFHFFIKYWEPLGEDYTNLPFREREASVEIPVFANLRVNMGKGKCIPFADIKAGMYATEKGGLYLNPSVGLRISTHEKQALNLVVGYTQADIEMRRLDKTNYHYGSWSYTTKPKDITTRAFSIKVGYEF